MNKEPVSCAICHKECKSDEDVGFLLFPGSNDKKAVHLNHQGVREEYEKQQKREEA